MPYNPGIQARPFHADMSGWGRALMSMLGDQKAERTERDSLIERYGGKAGQEGVPSAPIYGQIGGDYGSMEGPNEGTGEGGATDEMKAQAKSAKAFRDLGQHLYGYSREELSTKSLGELRGLARKEESAIVQQEKTQARQDRLAQFTQLTKHQNEIQRLQALSAGATVSNINSEIGLRNRNAAQDEAVGQGLATYARGGTNLNPEFSYSDWANRVGGLGNAPMPEASTPFTHLQRMDRAMQTDGLGGRGAIQLQDELRKLGPRPETPMDLAHINLYNAQAEAARARMNGATENVRPYEDPETGWRGAIYRHTLMPTGINPNRADVKPEAPPGYTPVWDGKKWDYKKTPDTEGVLKQATNPVTKQPMPGFFFDQTGKLHDLRDLMQKSLGPNAPGAAPAASTPSGAPVVRWGLDAKGNPVKLP